MSEPNRNAIRNRKDWIYDQELDTAIKVTDRNIAIHSQGRGTGFTYIVTTMCTIYSCYCSGNKSIQDLEETLYEIGRRIKLNKEKAIVVGDFNAKSPQWGSNVTDKRGQTITEWIMENGLVVVNEGNKPTFQRKDYSSILDLTLATDNIKNKIKHWEVPEIESLSDHNYIVFEVEECKDKSSYRKISGIGWQVNKLDKQKLQQLLIRRTDMETTQHAEEFSSMLVQLCNKTMPKRSLAKGRPVYWWNEEISQLRRECIRKRRTCTRAARRNQPEENQHLYNEYKECKKNLQNCIKRAKRAKWKELCDSVDGDIWGDGYKIVMKRMIGYPPRPQLTMQTVEEVVKHLFPVHQNVIFNCDINRNVIFLDFTADELRVAAEKLKNGKAPGPAHIPPEIIKEVTLSRSEYVLAIYNALAGIGNFPAQWKRATLVLLRKGDKPLDNPSSYRPICLLDVEGKLFEYLIQGRLNKELLRTGGLSENQYGFREGRQTVDAVNEVIKIARNAAAYPWPHQRLCAVLTLDVKNAFNSASWQLILEALNKRGIDQSLLKLVASYLSERAIILEAEGTTQSKPINSGVPQGSVLGPTLWNVLYNDLLEMDVPDGTTLIGFADDVAMVVVAEEEQMLMNIANVALQRASDWLNSRQLQLAPEKTEAVLLTAKRKIGPIQFNVQGTVVTPSKALKYLGVWLDTRLTFAEHVDKTSQKAGKTVTALSCLMPNIGGPCASKRRLLSSVIHSQILYAAPAWHTIKGYLIQKLSRIQRLMSIRVSSAYRTISTEGVGVIAGIPPIELLVKERNETYNGEHKKTARENLMNRWQERWTNGTYGRWTCNLIPNIQVWIGRPFGDVDYFVTQVLSGHGCFRKYLHSRKRADTETCVYCGGVDDVEHTMFACPKWEDVRMQYVRDTGKIFNAVNMMADLTTSEGSWNQAYRVIRHIIETKEKDSR